ncbi:hypothetical protein [Phenylobacterium aquaticum]|uniref:hypothetical protein n=1 Tax=Phenylobacterium aquaticum TaxID=1763816 RepID=UPI001F5C7326|nr:hypothetical protein [Phenylobacterium aquaticum]MCI3135234.1 hypothetical protein [Phenylobacterium aquaticum]
MGAAAGGATGGLLGALKDAGHSDEDAHVYAEGVRRGGALVSVRAANDTDRATAERILNGVSGVDASIRGAAYRAGGWQGFDPAAQPYSADEVVRERGLYGEDRSFAGSGERTEGETYDQRTDPTRAPIRTWAPSSRPDARSAREQRRGPASRRGPFAVCAAVQTTEPPPSTRRVWPVV